MTPKTSAASNLRGNNRHRRKLSEEQAHVPLTPPCGCGYPRLRSDRVCGRCGRVFR